MNISQQALYRAKKFELYKKNPDIFAEECVYLPTPGGDELIKLYEPQKKVLKSFYRDNYLCLLKSRQTGFSTLSQIIITHLTIFYSNVVCGIISRDGAESSDFNRKVIDILDRIPSWLHPGYKVQNAQSYILKNKSQLWASAISPSNPSAVFRGKSIAVLIIDEASFIPRIDDAWTGVAPSLSKAQTTARRLGIPFGTIILSTPNKKMGWYYKVWSEANSDPNSIFIPHKIHWAEIPEYRDDPEWYKRQCALLNNDQRKIAQEMELKFIASDGCLFTEEVQEKLQESKTGMFVNKLKLEAGSLWVFKEEIDINRFYLIGIDTATEFGEDFSTIQVLDYETMEQIMEFKGKSSVKKFAEVIKKVSQMVPNNMIFVENNGIGNQTCEEIFLDTDYNYNIYGQWRKIKNEEGHVENKFQPGLNTNVKTRPLILDSLFSTVNENYNLIYSNRLALELVGLVSKGNRVEASTDSKDDLALAYAFCCYARTYLKETLGNVTNSAANTEDTSSWITSLNSETAKIHINPETDDMRIKADKFIDENKDKLQGLVDFNEIFSMNNND